MRKIWFAYGNLGYDGANGDRAKKVMENLMSFMAGKKENTVIKACYRR